MRFLKCAAVVAFALQALAVAGCGSAGWGLLGEPSAAMASASSTGYAGREIVVGWRRGANRPVADLPLIVDRPLPRLGMALVHPLGNVTLPDLAAQLRADPAVAFADLDGPMPGLEGPSLRAALPPMRRLADAPPPPAVNPAVPAGGSGALINYLGLAAATGSWALDPGKGAAATVSVLDTGIDPSVVSVAQTSTGSFQYQSFNGDPTDMHGHGTMVSAVIADAQMGVAPGAPLAVAKVLNQQGDGHIASTVAAAEWALSQQPAVLVLAIAAPRLAEIERVVAAAQVQGVVVVASAGNSGDTSLGDPALYPAAFAARYDNVIAVGAWDECGTAPPGQTYAFPQGAPAFFTAAQPWVTLVAPAVRIPTWTPKANDYAMRYPQHQLPYAHAGDVFPPATDRMAPAEATNTALAAAVVGGVVALVEDAAHAQGKVLTPGQVRQLLQRTASFVPYPGSVPGPAGPSGSIVPASDPREGAGVVNPTAALQALATM